MIGRRAARALRSQSRGENLLFEGAQGTLLDIDHGTYPFVTSSTASPAAPRPAPAWAPSMLHYVLGITKAYTTRVGGGPFPTELYDAVGKLAGKHSNQGPRVRRHHRPRRAAAAGSTPPR
jgi:adenylosuccinate synthase